MLRKIWCTMDGSRVSLPERVAVVAHDAGGANQVFALLRNSTAERLQPYLEGPALRLWKARSAGHPMCEDLASALEGASLLVTGTGWSSTLENRARVTARNRGLKSIALLDHWVNYEARFAFEDTMAMPDEIWVVDEFAAAIARTAFPRAVIQEVPDFYAQEQLQNVGPIDPTAKRLLYVLEPTRDSWGRDDLGELQALRYFLERLPTLFPDGMDVHLRPHPSDPPSKYDAFVRRQDSWPVSYDEGDLMGSIGRARFVAGCETYALTLALKAGRTVYCTLPPWAPQCRLPHSGLIHLKQICP